MWIDAAVCKYTQRCAIEWGFKFMASHANEFVGLHINRGNSIFSKKMAAASPVAGTRPSSSAVPFSPPYSPTRLNPLGTGEEIKRAKGGGTHNTKIAVGMTTQLKPID